LQAKPSAKPIPDLELFHRILNLLQNTFLRRTIPDSRSRANFSAYTNAMASGIGEIVSGCDDGIGIGFASFAQ